MRGNVGPVSSPPIYSTSEVDRALISLLSASLRSIYNEAGIIDPPTTLTPAHIGKYVFQSIERKVIKSLQSVKDTPI